MPNSAGVYRKPGIPRPVPNTTYVCAFCGTMMTEKQLLQDITEVVRTGGRTIKLEAPLEEEVEQQKEVSGKGRKKKVKDDSDNDSSD